MPTPTPLTPPLKLSNPYASIPSDDRIRINCSIDIRVHRFLFLGALPHHGFAQCALSTFIHKLYLACLDFNVPSHFDELNEAKVAQLLQNLNFNPPHVEPNASPKPQPRSRAKTGRTSGSTPSVAESTGP